jgi:hypothetical protein
MLTPGLIFTQSWPLCDRLLTLPTNIITGKKGLSRETMMNKKFIIIDTKWPMSYIFGVNLLTLCSFT